MGVFAYQFFILRVMIQMAMSLQVSAGCQSIQYVYEVSFVCEFFFVPVQVLI
ncbi:hypothetical protein Gogos_019512, partial [Gossypium gossypioides]|nr:hypothetical protein [Gossypium gossypioides]